MFCYSSLENLFIKQMNQTSNDDVLIVTDKKESCNNSENSKRIKTQKHNLNGNEAKNSS